MSESAPPPPAAPLAKTKIPAEFHDREYLKPWLEKPLDDALLTDVFKKLDGAQTLIGKKIGIPEGEDPKAWDEFLGKLRPGKADDYEIKTGENPDKEFITELRAAAHSAGMSKLQMARFVDKLLPHFQGREAKAKAEQDRLDKEFGALVEQAHGKDAEKVLKRVQAAIKEHTPAPLRPYIDRLDNNALAILNGVVNAVLEKYVPEEQLNPKDDGAPPGAGGREALEKEMRDIFGNPAWKNFQHPDHNRLKARMDEIMASPLLK